MNKLTKIFNDQKLTIIEQNGEPKFLLNDLVKILGLSNSRMVKDRLDDDVSSTYPIQDSLGRTQQATFVNEDGLYDVILDSRKPEAKRFRKWITSEVLPSIRKTGSYQIEQPKSQSELMLMYAEQFVNQEKEIKELGNKIDNVSNIVSLNNVDWRKKTTTIIRKIADKWSGIDPYRSVNQLAYQRFEVRAGCKLELRLNNRKERALAQGMTKTYIKNLNKLDVIAEEKRLIEIYIQVVKEMAIQFKVNINDFEFEGVI